MSRVPHSEFYKLNGYLTGLDILSPDETQRYLQSFLDYERHQGGKVSGAYRFKTHLLLPWMYELVTHPKILHIIKEIMGPDILCWSSDMFPKEPDTDKVCGWHQDSTYIGMTPPDALTVWVALTESTLDNACVRYSSGSHLQGQVPHKQTFSDSSLLLYGQEIPVAVDETTAVSAILQPGQASVHHLLTVHASGPNISETRRIGIAIRYCGAHVKQRADIGDSATLVCGNDHGNFPLEPRPERDFGEAEVAAHKKAVNAVGPQEMVSVK